MKSKKFTIVVAHYNQMNYIKESIYSIITQKYENIELIIADDGSEEFDQKEVEIFINKYKKDNIKNIKYIINKKNQGTVKLLNKALEISTGEYILFFAADDKLYDKNVLNNFVNEFEKNDSYNVVTAQSIMCDKTLKKRIEKYVNIEKALKNNEKSCWHLFEEMSKNCIYSSGSTAYKINIFKKYGNFDEKYKLIEDWTYWLKILKLNEMIYYSNFNALLHRDGGVSHNNSKNIPPHVIQFYKDLLNAYKYEIMPVIGKFSEENLYLTIQKYLTSLTIYSNKDDAIEKEYQEEQITFFEKYNVSEEKYNKYKLKKKQKNKKTSLKKIINNNKLLFLNFIVYISAINFLLPFLKNNNCKISIFLVIILYLLLYPLMHKIDTIDFLQSDSVTLAIFITSIASFFLKNLLCIVLLFIIANIIFYNILSLYYNKKGEQK